MKNLEHAKTEKQQQKEEKEKFNNVTNSTSVENQNQTHNARKEGMGKENMKR